MARSHSPKSEKSKVAGIPNPYLLAVMTAVLAGIFSVVGGYYTARFQAQEAIAQKQFEYRVLAYTAFLEKTEHSKAPVINQILTIGSMADHLATDSEIQEFEDRVSALLKKHSSQDIYQQLNSDLNTLRLHGTSKVAAMCDDILKSLLLKDYAIDWSKYPADIASSHDEWKKTQENGLAYGWEERMSPDERLMVVTISKLFYTLIAQLRLEIHGPST